MTSNKHDETMAALHSLAIEYALNVGETHYPNQAYRAACELVGIGSFKDCQCERCTDYRRLEAELTRLRDIVNKQREALERLGSMVAFDVPRATNSHDVELIARIDFARAAAQGGATT